MIKNIYPTPDDLMDLQRFGEGEGDGGGETYSAAADDTGIRQDDAGLGGLLATEGLDDDAVAQGSELEVSRSLSSSHEQSSRTKHWERRLPPIGTGERIQNLLALCKGEC